MFADGSLLEVPLWKIRAGIAALLGVLGLVYMKNSPERVRGLQESKSNLLESWNQHQVGSCIWSPSQTDPFNMNGAAYQTHTCSRILQDRLRASSALTTTTATPTRRWLLIGDSTMGKLYLESGLKDKLLTARQIQAFCPSQLLCYSHYHKRCELNQDFLYPPIHPEQWMPPNFSLGEGPVAFGLNNSNCQDCAGCNSLYSVCYRKQYEGAATMSSDKCVFPWNQENIHHDDNKNPTTIINSTDTNATVYGGYFSVEFARDVEVQTPYYKTTQENFAAFLHKEYNQDRWLMEQFGGPSNCIIGSGFHDMAIPNITLEQYLVNVEWFLALLLLPNSGSDVGANNNNDDNIGGLPACSHVIWLQNTSPLRQNDTDPTYSPWPQTVEKTKKWNEAVSLMLRNSTILPRYRLTVLDVFKSSQDYENRDNVHLTWPWYKALGAFFMHVIDQVSTPASMQDQSPPRSALPEEIQPQPIISKTRRAKTNRRVVRQLRPKSLDATTFFSAVDKSPPSNPRKGRPPLTERKPSQLGNI